MRFTTLYWAAAAALLAATSALAQSPGGAARPGPLPADELPAPYVTRMSDVEIPFSVKAAPSPDRQPSAVRVFVSWDRGQAWHLYEEKKPEDGRFRFKPKQDGEYWFATQTVDRTGASDNPQPKEPQLRLVIDTQKPQLLVQASVVRAGEVTLTWSAADPTLQPMSLKVEYQGAAGSGGPWQQVAIEPAAMTISAGQATGRVTFEPEVRVAAILLRAEVADAAGNVAYFSQRLSLSPTRMAQAGSGSAPPPDRTATRWPSDNPFAKDGSQGPTVVVADDEASVPGVVSNPFAGEGQPPPIHRDAFVSSGQPRPPAVEQLPPPNRAPEVLPAPAAPSDPLTAAPRGVSDQPGTTRPSAEHAPLPPPVYGGTHSPAEDIGPIPGGPQREHLPAFSPSAGPSLGPAVEDVGVPQGSRPRLTNSRRFSLDYDVESVGPEGLADVELWGTSDGGRTWVKWGSDPDKQSPFDVEVNGEAVYGFRVVILGKSGLASNAPHSGDAADIWVGIDMTRPRARLVSAAYGEGPAAGKLDIRWEADDANLTSRPVTLAIGDRPEGPFTPIAAGLPNSGQYLWEYDPRSPRLLYLRLEVRDEAGNLAIDQLSEPIRVEGLQPKGRIRGFLPSDAPSGTLPQPQYR